KATSTRARTWLDRDDDIRRRAPSRARPARGRGAADLGVRHHVPGPRQDLRDRRRRRRPRLDLGRPRDPGRTDRDGPPDVRQVGVRRPVRVGDGRPGARGSRAAREPPARGMAPNRAEEAGRYARGSAVTGPENLPDHVQRNRAAWDEWAPEFVANAEISWRLGPGEEKWGVWDIPEREVHLLPDDLAGKDAVELGCGTAYVSAW